MILLALVLEVRSMAYSGLAHISVSHIGPLSSSLYVNKAFFASYNNASRLALYTLLSYSAYNFSSALLSIASYSSNPIRPIYILNVTQYSINTFNEQDLVSALESYLSNLGLILNRSSFNYVSLQNLSAIEPGSIVIVPSGLMPLPLLQNSSGIFELLNKGDTIIYIGQAFNKSVSSGGIIYITPPSMLSQLASYNITSFPLPSNMSKPNSSLFSKPTFALSHGSLWNDIAYTKAGNGTFIAFSNYPTFAWSNLTSFAHALAYSINAAFWIPKLAYVEENVTNATGKLGIFTNQTSIPFGDSNEANSSTNIARLTISNSTSYLTKIAVFKANYSGIAKFSLPSVVYDAANTTIFVNVTSPTPVQLHIDLLNQNLSYVESIPMFHSFSGTVAFELRHIFTLPSGTYVALLRNQFDENYSIAVFKIPQLVLTPVSLNFKNGTFVFNVYSGTYPVTASGILSLDGAYAENVSIQGGKLLYSLPKGTLVSYGKQTFKLGIFGTTLTYSVTYSKEIMHIPAFYIELGIVLLAILLLNLVLKPPNRDEYYIDVPTFLPEKKEVAKTTPQDLVSVFEKLNYYYHWSFMPITLDEFKNGISNYIRIGNAPISITTQNAQNLLQQLIKQGLVTEANGYYLLTSWIDASKHDAEYLVIFRQLRDYCVSHAMLFTDLNTEPIADMLITKSSRQAAVIIYSSQSGMRKFSVSSRLPTFIVFLNEDIKREFTKKLYLSYTKSASVLKLAIDYSYVKLISLETLDQLIV
ncbi:MAG: hypothetical protein ACP5GD_01360 [Candidatus Micrarchaeia archaeon]